MKFCVDLPDDLLELITFHVHACGILVTRLINNACNKNLQLRFEIYRMKHLIVSRYAPKFRNIMEDVGLIKYTLFFKWPKLQISTSILRKHMSVQCFTSYTQYTLNRLYLSEESIFSRLLQIYVYTGNSSVKYPSNIVAALRDCVVHTYT